ncbi:hypothetical protein QUF50_10515, partial [Thiotrichales bacterium HSG1]|nr:hypothetical protein [Thiotrichales bacterium HSG1]
LQDNETGILHVEGKDETGGVKNQFAFLPDGNNITQVDKNNISSKLSVDQGCFYNVTTSQGQKIRVLPAVKDPNDLSKVINNGQVVFGEQGEFVMDIPNNTRNDETSRVSATVDPFIENASECIDPTLCEFGLIFSDTRDKRQTAKITYSDGTSQKIMPAVYKPNSLIEKGLSIPGVKDIVLNMDGTFSVVYLGKKYLLRPNFNLNSRKVPEGKKVKTKLVINKHGGLTYTIGVNLSSDSTTQNLALKFNLSIEPLVKKTCE